MKIDKKYFEYLSLLHLDSQQEKRSVNFQACKNESILQSTNRVFFQNRITSEDMQQLYQFYENKPFTIWLNKTNSEGNRDAEEFGLKKLYYFPLMQANLKNLSLSHKNPSIRVDQLVTKDAIINFWSDLVATVYHISSSEFKKFVTYLLSVEKINYIQFYVGYFNHSAAAASMFIQREDTVDIHWVGTLPEFRNKGLGQAVTVFPLQKVKAIATTSTAILYASTMGKPLYEQIGFAEVGECYVYGNK